MKDEHIPAPVEMRGEPDDGGNQPIGCVGDDPNGPGGHEQDEFVEPLTPPEDDPEGERQPEEDLLEEPIPDEIPEDEEDA